MKFELHCHSHYSKGTKIVIEAPQSPKEIARTIKKKGLDGFALTDHRVNNGWKEAEEEAKKLKLTFIPGIEIDTQKGHLLALGLNSPVKNFLTLDETLEKIHEQGAIGIAAHPFDIRNMGLRKDIKKVDAVEVFNSLSLDRFSNKVAEKHAKKLKKPMTAGSDAHSLDMLGSSINHINAESVDSIISEIKKGNVVIEKNYVDLNKAISWSRMRMNLSYDQISNYIDNNYSLPKKWLAKKMLNWFVFSKRSDDYWSWRYMAKLGFGCSGIYSRIKLAKY